VSMLCRTVGMSVLHRSDPIESSPTCGQGSEAMDSLSNHSQRKCRLVGPEQGGASPLSLPREEPIAEFGHQALEAPDPGLESVSLSGCRKQVSIPWLATNTPTDALWRL
jgi:hypothetical protein